MKSIKETSIGENKLNITTEENWRTDQPPNEVWIEVIDGESVTEAMAFYGRDGWRPHWRLKDGICCSPSRFSRWREIKQLKKLSTELPMSSDDNIKKTITDTVKVSVQVDKTVTITFPYFYKRDLLLDFCDCIIYGKVNENEHQSIKIAKNSESVNAEVEKEFIDWRLLGCYYNQEDKSSEEEYLKAKQEALALINMM